MKTITELASLPTNSDGTRQVRVGITKLHNAIESGRFVEHNDNSITLDNVTYKPNPLAALTFVLANKFDAMPDMLRLFESDYAMPMQYEAALVAAKVGMKKTTPKPLTGHYLTAADYLESCYSLLPEQAQPTLEDVFAILADFKPSFNKTELVALIEQVIALKSIGGYTLADLTQEQYAKYDDLCMKESALADATLTLSPYLDDIKPVRDNALQGKLYPERGFGEVYNQVLREEKWVEELKTPVPAKLDANYNIVEPMFILVTVKVC